MVTSAGTFMPMPSFGAVFGGDLHHTAHDLPLANSSANGSNVAPPASNATTTNGAPFSSFHIHHDSRDSNSTASSDNSPTTTISTMDGSSVTDPSPGPSPESPLAKTAPSASFAADFRARRTESHSGESSSSAFFELQRPTTPAKKPRNLKNLGINTTTSLTNLRSNPPAPLVVPSKEKNNSAPPSPLFIKPPSPPRRRPSNLSLTISGPNSTDNKPIRLLIPSTPSVSRPGLRHFQSSPSLPVSSPSLGAAPGGGMKLPALRTLRTNTSSGLSEVPFEMEEEEDLEPNFDVPQSREEKPAAYPNGPICIYEAGVYLYFEPTAEQASTFDVIINVASEVKNPFTALSSGSQKDLDARRVDGPPAENVDFAALSRQPRPAGFGRQSSSPTTPKAASVVPTVKPGEINVNGKTYRTPEYIHMPWEHNTDIVPDLYKLVKIMDERVQQGKRVLIHCQCGVSRSASLVVAYGLYKNPQVSVQEAYDKAKKRSKWIGPNMNLIMQLQEFRNGLLRANDNRSYHNQSFGRRSAGLPTTRSVGVGGYTPFDRDMASGSRTPQTAPLPPDSDMNSQRASTGNMMAISPGPLSAPTGSYSPGFRRSWGPHFDLPSQVPRFSPVTTPLDESEPPVVPVLSVTNNDSSYAQIGAMSDIHVVQPEQEPSLSQSSVPNFSRQLPFRQHDGIDDPVSHNSVHALHAPLQSFSFGSLRSPAVSSFDLASIAPRDQSAEPEIMSPVKTSFGDDLWTRDLNLASPALAPTPRKQKRFVPPPSMSLRSKEPHIAEPQSVKFSELEDLSPPRTTSSNPTWSTQSQPPKENDHSTEPFVVASPIVASFPKDIFGQIDGCDDDELDENMKSPRAAEFHMTPLKPRVIDEDPFGLTSPSRGDFQSNPFDRLSLAPSQETLSEYRRPAFQAIMPPTHSSFSGFASLDGTAYTQSAVQTSAPNHTFGSFQNLVAPPRPKTLRTVSETEVSAPLESSAPERPQTPKEVFLSTPAKTIRTRFSSPNMREKRELQKLQTEISSKLPTQHAVDDLDTLKSPRSEEFTKNPFQLDLRSPDTEHSPASSNETIKAEQNEHVWSIPEQWTPEKATVDPRSPVQTGVPIVRNIWDVL